MERILFLFLARGFKVQSEMNCTVYNFIDSFITSEIAKLSFFKILILVLLGLSTNFSTNFIEDT